MGIWTKNNGLEEASEGGLKEDKLEDETKGKNLSLNLTCPDIYTLSVIGFKDQ